MLNCKQCNYTCKKDKSLKNHILKKHEHHQCKECEEKLPNFMQLMKHAAQHNTKNQSETQALQLDKEEAKSKDLKEKDQLEELEAEVSLLKKEIL